MNLKKSSVALLAVFGLATSTSAVAQTAVHAGDEVPYALSSPAIYPDGAAHRPVVWTDTIVSSGATFVRVHFERFNLPQGDYLTISNPEGTDFWIYTGRGPQDTGEFWSFAVDGDTLVMELHGGPKPPQGRMARFGLEVDSIAHGTLVPEELVQQEADKSICGTDGRQNAACHSSINMNPVARLLFQRGGSSYVCTGWLVKGSNANTMLTNNHCFTTQSEVNTVQARFNYQTTTCGGSTAASFSSYNGGTFLKTNSSLDYTIFTLSGNPEATWGEYTATTKTPTTSMSLNFPQHPGGGLKEIAYWKDSSQTLRCNNSYQNQTVPGYSSSSQMLYSCDSEGGSSGSPVLDAGTGRVIGLHHLGNVSSSGCLNAGTQMKNVCSNAGSLLTCASN